MNSPRDDIDVLRVEELRKDYPISYGALRKPKLLRALGGISFNIRRGETVGLVGESGCGKSTVGKTVMRLQQPTSGSIFFEGQDITALSREEMRPLAKRMAMVFQDPYSSLNPRLRILDSIAEPLRTHTGMKGSAITDRVVELLEQVGLRSDQARRYPHEFSGGQRQRISLARALALNPSFLVMDEPTSALDVSVQAQVLNLIADLQERLQITYLFISHNLAVVEHLAHRVIIMYLGKIVEMGRTEDVFTNARHPYTQALLAAVPSTDPDNQVDAVLSGEIPSPVDVPIGCAFQDRCPHVMSVCRQQSPHFSERDRGHKVACHLYQAL
jgi:oligopeptide transport system ATP-binding protein